MIKNINPKFGEEIVFETEEEMVEAIRACGYAVDELEEDIDFEEYQPTIKVENSEEEEYAILTISDEFASVFAKEDQTVLGSQWETDGSGFAYALVVDYVGLIEDLRREYLNVDDSEFTPKKKSIYTSVFYPY